MRKIIIVVLVLLLAGICVFIYFSDKGYSVDAMVNSARTRSISVKCGKVHSFLVTSTMDVEVFNRSEKEYKHVAVHVKAYDKNGKEIKEKTIGFGRTLHANDSMSKTITLPGRARSCKCVVEDADAEPPSE